MDLEPLGRRDTAAVNVRLRQKKKNKQKHESGFLVTEGDFVRIGSTFHRHRADGG